MRKSFSVGDKQFLRRIFWLLILALFSVLIFWQQTRAEPVNPVVFGEELEALVAETGIEAERPLIHTSGQSRFYAPHVSLPSSSGHLLRILTAREPQWF
jgi:hypothetical protein